MWKSTVGAVLRYGSEVWFADVREEIELERVQLKIIKQVLRLNRSTVDEFVRGEVGMFELRRERDKMMLVWLGRVQMMSRDRWVRRVYDMEWGVKNEQGGGRLKSWKNKVMGLVREYDLEEEFDVLVKGGHGVEEWKKIVK